MKPKREQDLEAALKLCIDALYVVIFFMAPRDMDKLPRSVGMTLQEAKAILMGRKHETDSDTDSGNGADRLRHL